MKRLILPILLLGCLDVISASGQIQSALQPLPPGHRWVLRTNVVTVAEPIPTPATYWCFHPSGSLSMAGHYNTDAEALTACGSGSQGFVDGHDAIVKRDETTGEFSILWQFKAGFHMRQGAVTNSTVISSITNIAASGILLHHTPATPPMPPPWPNFKDRWLRDATNFTPHFTPQPIIAPSPVRGSTTVSVSGGPPGTPVPIVWGWSKKAFLEDCVTEVMVTNAIGIVFAVRSNNTYRAWCAGNIAGPWKEYLMSHEVQPATSNQFWSYCLPIGDGQRFYQITQTIP